MKLHDLKPNKGKTKKKIRAARGTAGRRGKTAGRGTKGQNSRAGGGTSLFFEGGNLPFYRRLPYKRGFTPPNQIVYSEINLDQLDGFKAKAEVSAESLAEARLLKKIGLPIVILGRGDVKKALNFKVHRVTKGAREKIEAAGGSIEIIGEAAEAAAAE